MSLRIACPSCSATLKIAPENSRKRLTCPKCGSGFRSPLAPTEDDTREVARSTSSTRSRRAERDQDDHDDADDRRGERREERRGFKCPFCASAHPPRQRTRVSTAGWVLFCLSILTMCGVLFCWVPLLIFREPYRACQDCGIKLG